MTVFVTVTTGPIGIYCHVSRYTQSTHREGYMVHAGCFTGFISQEFAKQLAITANDIQHEGLGKIHAFTSSLERDPRVGWTLEWKGE